MEAIAQEAAYVALIIGLVCFVVILIATAVIMVKHMFAELLGY